MALSADRPYMVRGESRIIKVILTAGVTYYKGSILNVTAGGLGIKAADTAGIGHFSGVLTKGKVATSADNIGELEIGTIFIPFASAAQADVGDRVYATADDTIAMSATNANPCGRVEDAHVGVGSWVNFEQGIEKTALA